MRKHFVNLRSSVQRSTQRVQRIVQDFAASPAVAAHIPTAASAQQTAALQDPSLAAAQVAAAQVAADALLSKANEYLASLPAGRQRFSDTLAPLLNEAGGVRDVEAATHLENVYHSAVCGSQQLAVLRAVLATDADDVLQHMSGDIHLQSYFQKWVMDAATAQITTVLLVGLKVLLHTARLLPGPLVLGTIQQLERGHNQAVARVAEALRQHWEVLRAVARAPHPIKGTLAAVARSQSRAAVAALAVPPYQKRLPPAGHLGADPSTDAAPPVRAPAPPAAGPPSALAQRLAAMREQIPFRPPPDCAESLAAHANNLPMLQAGLDAWRASPVAVKGVEPAIIPFCPVDPWEARQQNALFLADGVTMAGYVTR